MKKILTFLMMFAMTAGILSAQTMVDQPTADQQGPTLSYQLVVRDANNNLVVDQDVDVRVSIVSTVAETADNASSYVEPFYGLHTNNNGMLSLTLGGEGADGNFMNVDWANSNIRIEVYYPGANEPFMEFQEEVFAVPYALNAGFLLTTQQIVDYLTEGNGQGDQDVVEICAALRGNSPLHDTIREVVVDYIKYHYNIAKQIAYHYASQVTGADVREAYDSVMALNADVKQAIVDNVKRYLKNHRSLAMELAKYYVSTATDAEIQTLYNELKSNTEVYSFAQSKVNAVLDSYLKTHGLDTNCLHRYNFNNLCDLAAALQTVNEDPNDTCPRITSVSNTANDGLVALYLNGGVIMTAYVKNYDPNKVSSFGFKLNNDNTIRPARYIELSNNFGKFVDTLNETQYCGLNVTATAILVTNSDCVVENMEIEIEIEKEMTYTVPGYNLTIEKEGNTLKAVFTPTEAQQYFASERPNNIEWFVGSETTPRATGMTFVLPDTYTTITAKAHLRECRDEATYTNN